MPRDSFIDRAGIVCFWNSWWSPLLVSGDWDGVLVGLLGLVLIFVVFPVVERVFDLIRRRFGSKYNLRNTNLMDTRPEYAFNYFSQNPEVFESQSKYVVKTNGWRSLFRLFAGSRKLRIRPNEAELSLSVRNYWLFTHSVVLPFNRIDHIHPAFASDWGINSQIGAMYSHIWYIKIVLRNPQEEIDLFHWAEGGFGQLPTIPEKGKKGAEYEAVLNRLHQLTGAKISYE